MYKLVIFDLDGTLLNTLNDLADNLNFVLKGCGFPERTLDEVRSFVGNGIHKLIERGVPSGTGSDDIERVFSAFNAYYRLHDADKTVPYDGIEAVLKQLRAHGILTAVVSNKADYAVQDLCAHFFPGLLDFCTGERAELRRKPYPDLCELVLKNLNTAKKDAVYVGDSEVDIQTALNCGLDCISVSWGFKDRDFLQVNNALSIIDTPKELIEKILENK